MAGINQYRFMENTEIVDLFEFPEQIPADVVKVLEKYGADLTYKECREMLAEVKQLGYTFEYGLDAIPTNLQKVN